MRLYKKGGSVHTVLATTEFVGLSCTRNVLCRSWCTVSLVVTKPPTYLHVVDIAQTVKLFFDRPRPKKKFKFNLSGTPCTSRLCALPRGVGGVGMEKKIQ